MSTGYSWEGKGRYGSFRLRGWTRGCYAGKTARSFENTCHTWALLMWCIKCMYLLW